ncbi:MAG: GNAT family N-acetyltransferase [Pseudomonadota bacterium]
MPDISVRLATPDDGAAYHQFMDAIYSENLDTLIPPAASTKLELTYRYVIQHDAVRSALFLAEAAGRIVGAANFTRFVRLETDHTIGVGLYVDKDNRGRGIGRRLMEAGIAWANSVPDIERIELLVMENNRQALGLYESLGFAYEGLKRSAVKKPHGYFNIVVMALLMKQAANI